MGAPDSVIYYRGQVLPAPQQQPLRPAAAVTSVAHSPHAASAGGSDDGDGGGLRTARLLSSRRALEDAAATQAGLDSSSSLAQARRRDAQTQAAVEAALQRAHRAAQTRQLGALPPVDPTLAFLVAPSAAEVASAAAAAASASTFTSPVAPLSSRTYFTRPSSASSTAHPAAHGTGSQPVPRQSSHSRHHSGSTESGSSASASSTRPQTASVPRSRPDSNTRPRSGSVVVSPSSFAHIVRRDEAYGNASVSISIPGLSRPATAASGRPQTASTSRQTQPSTRSDVVGARPASAVPALTLDDADSTDAGAAPSRQRPQTAKPSSRSASGTAAVVGRPEAARARPGLPPAGAKFAPRVPHVQVPSPGRHRRLSTDHSSSSADTTPSSSLDASPLLDNNDSLLAPFSAEDAWAQSGGDVLSSSTSATGARTSSRRGSNAHARAKSPLLTYPCASTATTQRDVTDGTARTTARSSNFLSSRSANNTSRTSTERQRPVSASATSKGLCVGAPSSSRFAHPTSLATLLVAAPDPASLSSSPSDCTTTSRSVASSVWPSSTATTARWSSRPSSTASSSAAARQRVAGASPMRAAPLPVTSESVNHGAPPAPLPPRRHPLVERLQADLHALAKKNDVEGALRCVQMLLALRTRTERREQQHRSFGGLDASSSSPTASPVSDADDVPSLSEFAQRYFLDRSGSTPLFHAAWGGHRAMALLVLECGAALGMASPSSSPHSSQRGGGAGGGGGNSATSVVNHRNVRGNSALDLAIERSHFGMVKLLLAHGAKLATAATLPPTSTAAAAPPGTTTNSSPVMSALDENGVVRSLSCSPQASLRSLHSTADHEDDADPASGPAALRRLDVLATRAAYELSPHLVSFLHTRASLPHKVLKLSFYVRSGASRKIEALFRSNPRSMRRWCNTFVENGLTLLGLAARFGHTEVARLLLRDPQDEGEGGSRAGDGGVDPNALCAVRGDGDMIEDEEAEVLAATAAPGTDADSGENSSEYSEDEYDENGYDEEEGGEQSVRKRPSSMILPPSTRLTNAFALAVQHGHYMLALELFEQHGARVDYAPPELLRQIAATRPHVRRTNASDNNFGFGDGDEEEDEDDDGELDVDPTAVRSALMTLQRLSELAQQLQLLLVDLSLSGASGSAILASLRAFLSQHCGGGSGSQETRGAVVRFPDERGRSSLHVALQFQQAEALEMLLREAEQPDPTAMRPSVAKKEKPSSIGEETTSVHAQRDLLRRMTLLEMALESDNLTLVYVLLSHGAQIDLPSLLRAMDRKASPHSKLSQDNGMRLLSFFMEQRRAAVRLAVAQRDHEYAVACAAARAAGLPLPPLLPVEGLLSPAELVAMLNGTGLDATFASTVLQALLPALQADAIERGDTSLPASAFNLSALKQSLHAVQLAQGKPVLSEADKARGGSSGYGKANSGLIGVHARRNGGGGNNNAPGVGGSGSGSRGAGADDDDDEDGGAVSARRRVRNKLHDPGYLASLLARQRAHTAAEQLLWSSSRAVAANAGDPADAEERRRHEQDLASLQRMEESMLGSERIALLLGLLRELQLADSDALPLRDLAALQEEQDLAQKAEELRRFGHDMFSVQAMQFRAARAAQRAQELRKAAAVAIGADGAAPLNEQGEIDWTALARRVPTRQAQDGKHGAAAAADTVAARRARLPFHMPELLSFNPRLRTGLPPQSKVAAAARHTNESWIRAWQEQAWDESLHSIDVLLRELSRRRDVARVDRKDHLPLAFLWPNAWSREQVRRAARAREERAARVAEMQAKRERWLGRKNDPATTAAATAATAAAEAEAAAAAAEEKKLKQESPPAELSALDRSAAAMAAQLRSGVVQQKESLLASAPPPLPVPTSTRYGRSSRSPSHSGPAGVLGGGQSRRPSTLLASPPLSPAPSSPLVPTLLYSTQVLALAEASEALSQRTAKLSARNTAHDVPAWMKKR